MNMPVLQEARLTSVSLAYCKDSLMVVRNVGSDMHKGYSKYDGAASVDERRSPGAYRASFQVISGK